MKILSSFTHPQVFQTCMNFFVLPNTKEDIWRKFVTRLFWGTIDFHSRKKNTMEVNGAQNCSVSHILQNIFLCVQQNKDIHTGLELLEGE